MTFRELSQALSAARGHVPPPSERSTAEHAHTQETAVLALRADRTAHLVVAPVQKRLGRHRVRMLAFNGSVPGPILVVDQGSTANVEVRNDMASATTVLWHGLRSDARFGGVPSVGRRGGSPSPIEPGESFTYALSFPDPGVFCYHVHLLEDHAQEVGPYGAIVVRPSEPEYWPPVDREFVAILDDLPVQRGAIAPFRQTTSDPAATGRTKNVLLVNGDPDGRFEARQGDVVRFHLINVARARPFNVRIPGARLKRVGCDQGRVERERFVDEVLLAPWERAVVDVLFPRSGAFDVEHRTPGKSMKLATVDVASAEAGGSHRVAFETLRYNPEFATVRARLEWELSRAPDRVLRMDGELPSMRHVAHSAEPDERNDSSHVANRPSAPSTMRWKLVDQATGSTNHRIDWTFELDSRIKLRLVNATDADHPMHHPFHIQGQRFLVLARDGVPNASLAWKDTILLRAGEVTDLLVEMSNPGTWLMRCHIAEHREAGMMLSFHVHPGSDPDGRSP